MINGQGEWHRLKKILYEKRKSKKKRVNKRKTKIIMGGTLNACESFFVISFLQ